MPELLNRPVKEWDAFYGAVLEHEGTGRLRTIKARLYDKLELIHDEIEDLEDLKETVFQAFTPDVCRDIDKQVEDLVQQGQAISLQIEVLTRLLGEEATI